MELNKTVLITQARTGSSRLPGKVLKEVNGKTLLKIHLERLSQCENISDIIVATTTSKEDEKIFNLAKDWGFKSYRGSEEDVLDRFYQAAKPLKPDWIVRTTSDCPLLDPKLVDDVIEFAKRKKADYVSNVIESKFPDGQDVEVFTFSALEEAWLNADKLSEREHVTPFIRNNSNIFGGNKFSVVNFPLNEDYSNIRMTVDEPEDFELIKNIIEELGTDLTWKEYTNYIIKNNLGSLNQHIQRNEGYLKSLKEDQE